MNHTGRPCAAASERRNGAQRASLLTVVLCVAVTACYERTEQKTRNNAPPETASATSDARMKPQSTATEAEKTYERPIADVPQFSDYPSLPLMKAAPKPVRLNSHPDGRRYRSAIRFAQDDSGINFAGCYTVAMPGCGTGCSVAFIVDGRSGNIVFADVMFSGADFRTDSRLFIETPLEFPAAYNPTEELGLMAPHYYEWDGRCFKYLGTLTRLDRFEREDGSRRRCGRKKIE